MHPRRGVIQAILLSLVTIALLCLGGCQAKNTDIAPALPVISDSTYNADTVSVALGADGSHHLIYVDSGKDISDLVYAYQKKSEPLRLLS
ncbi:MAG TPA: hypothetical protein VHO48_13255, partial [Anaerolineaceae bacterium]|nr:hypothetical protein [Anaerolineaceae bacterium]